MKQINIDERKQIQLQILDAVSSFCEDRGIRYSLACGTLLGAVRHGGYIPWDDDIDIYMLREDYKRFEEEFPTTYKGRYKFGSIGRDENWTCLFGKVWDDRTMMVELRQKTSEMGVNIDVFPIDEVPDDNRTFEEWNKWRKKKIIDIRRSSFHFSKDFSLWQNILIPFIKLRYIFFDNKKALRKLNREIQKFNGIGSNMVYESSCGVNGERPFLKGVFENIVDTSFEDRKYKAFANYDEYLTQTYGDYMTLPPVEKRVAHHMETSYWK